MPMTKRGLMGQLALYAALDLLCGALGMGVPVLCIALGFPVGWRIVRVLRLADIPVPDALARILVWAALTSGFTFVIMAVVWGRCVPMLFDPAADIANFGMPLILYEPRPSFVAWLVLMIVISPVLQFLVTVLGADVALLRDASARRR
jgi:hypothetical protein